MSSKPKSTNQEEESASIGSIAGALECIAGWEKLRGRRDLADGSLSESQMKLDGITGNFTDLAACRTFEFFRDVSICRHPQAGRHRRLWVPDWQSPQIQTVV